MRIACRVKETSRAKSSWHEESNKIGDSVEHQSSVQDPDRNRSSQDITVVCDVTGKESFNKVKIRLEEINKHVSNGVNKDRETKEAQDFSKSEAEMFDVLGTLQRTISIIEKEMAKNPTFLQKEIGTRNTNTVMTALITRTSSMSRETADTKYNVYPVAKIAVMSKDRRDSIRN